MAEDVRVRVRQELAARHPAPRSEPIEWGRVRDFLAALDEPVELAPGAPVPPLFLLTLGRTRRPQPSKGGAVKVGDEFEFLAPVHIGDTITVGAELGDVAEKTGQRGTMYLVTTEWTYRNQRGELVATGKTKTMRWGQ
jgi:hypothetical protein